jgi:hypothetical protein
MQVPSRPMWRNIVTHGQLKENLYIYYTLRFYFPYLSLLAQPVTIFLYGPVTILVYGPVTILVYGPARYLHYYCPLLCFKYHPIKINITSNVVYTTVANSSWHWGSYGSIWTGPSPKKYDMDRRLCICGILYFRLNGTRVLRK